SQDTWPPGPVQFDPSAREHAERRPRGVVSFRTSVPRCFPDRTLPPFCNRLGRRLVGTAGAARGRADSGARRRDGAVDLLRGGRPGGVTSLFVRGGESNYTKVLLDGIPLNEPGGGFDFSNVTTGGLDRIEFVRGANSALYGSDAMTGVIQLFTARGRSAHPDVHFALEGGTFSTGRVSAGIAAKAGRFDYAIDSAGLTTDNQAPNNEFRNTTLAGSAGALISRGVTLRMI